jgi:hypothetical protein
VAPIFGEQPVVCVASVAASAGFEALPGQLKFAATHPR